MGLITGPKKGDISNLDVTQKAQHRIVIGLSWDEKNLSKGEKLKVALSGLDDVLFGDIFLVKANTDRIMDKMDHSSREEDDPNFDLDLSCLSFDSKGNIISVVDPDAWNAIDQSGKIYHSGDAMAGQFVDETDQLHIESTHDDEQIHIELKDISEDIHDFFIIVQSDCAASFADVLNPEIRVADSMTNKNFLQTKIDGVDNSDGSYGFVYCRIFKQGNDWKVKNISQFCDFQEDWAKYLMQFR